MALASGQIAASAAEVTGRHDVMHDAMRYLCHVTVCNCLLCIAKRRTARARVKLWSDGTGKALVNNLLLIEYFPNLQDRYIQLPLPLDVCYVSY